MLAVETPQSICRFGLARCDITPPVGVYHRMWGAAAHDRATGVHRPLTATAMVFQSADGSATARDDDRQVLLTMDHCLLWDREHRALVEAVCRGSGLDPQRLTVTFSHTHAAGLMGWERENLPGGELVRPYLDELAGRLTEIVTQAGEQTQTATAVYGQGRCNLAAHRDLWDEESGQFVCGFDPNTPVDDTLLVARFSDEQGNLMADVVNYACHPTTLAWDNTLISPDYPGAMREVIEAATGAPCVFLQGASGDVGPREGFVGDVQVADRNGRQLGYAALAVLESLPPPATRFQYTGPVVSGATIGTWEHEPLDGKALIHNSRWRLRRWTVDLPYRPGLPTAAATEVEQRQWQQREAAARKKGDALEAASCRAMAERMERRLVRLRGLTGETFAYPLQLWQIGGALWLTVEGEPYSQLQTALRRRFPDIPLIVCELAGGSRPSYLPPREIYGKGIYQESIAVLAPGCLETVIEEIAGQMDEWMA